MILKFSTQLVHDYNDHRKKEKKTSPQMNVMGRANKCVRALVNYI